MSKPFNRTPHLVVERSAGIDGTNLAEFWVLKSYSWSDMQDGEYEPNLHVFIASYTSSNEIVSSGLPFKDDRVQDMCKWSEAPQEIRDAFKREVTQMQESMADFEMSDNE